MKRVLTLNSHNYFNEIYENLVPSGIDTAEASVKMKDRFHAGNIRRCVSLNLRIFWLSLAHKLIFYLC
eukprot:snap_masked-scaffold_9-processed-gene-4.27-mRNA-1 protein AED:1.00 eAED:1.00 QI:0/0/0/0/1/1/2/0/67